MIEILRPASLGEALEWLAGAAPGGAAGPPLSPLAGGTDLYPAQAAQSRGARWLDIASLRELAGVTEDEHDGRPVWRIGAATRWSALAHGEHVHPHWRALSLAAAEVGGRQIQNRGTLGGNLCHASPAADGVPALLVLEACVLLRSRAGVRRLPLADFILGPRTTARRRDELLEAVLVGRPTHRRLSTFLKLGHRRYLVISAVMVAARLDLDASGRVAGAALAVGACGPRAVNLPWFPEALQGLDAAGVRRLAGRSWPEQALAPLSPIDDLRGTAAFRREAAARLVARALAELADAASEGPAHE